MPLECGYGDITFQAQNSFPGFQVLTPSQVRIIDDEKGTEKNAAIISFLYRKPDVCYTLFTKCLRDSMQSDIAELLETPPRE